MTHLTAIRRSTLALCAALALAAPARAGWPNEPPAWATGRIVDVQVRVEGEAAPLYVSPNDDGRHYVQAYAGRHYSLVLHNRSDRRIGVLIAVDGLNVVNGERTQRTNHEPMYVLDPYETATIQGWRTSLAEVRRFVFVDESRSYASRTDQANGDMGWIRVLAFREQPTFTPPWGRFERGSEKSRFDDRSGAPPAAEPRAQAVPAPAAPAPLAEDAPQGALGGEAKTERREIASRNDALGSRDESGFPGTGWGDHRSDPVREVEFRAERCATDTHVFRYEYASGLRALGIVPERNRLHERDSGELGFAKPPRW